MSRPDFYTIHHGRQKLQVPRAWDTFRYHGRRYRIHDGQVLTEDAAGWHPSIWLTISAPKGRRG